MAPQSAEARITITAKDLTDKGIQSATQGLKNLGASVTSVGKKMSLFVTGPLLALGTLAVKTASDFEETQSKFRTVFGQFADDSEKWAADFSASVGRSRGDIMGWMSTIQDTFVPLGFARDQSAEFSKTLTTLAVDLASFNNVADDKALADLQTAIVGNVEVMRKYGVIINQATLDQELLNLGVEGGVQAATEQQKALARLNIIMQGTTDAQGDALRTAGSFANQMRSLKAVLSDVFIEFGTHILPVLSKVIDKIKQGLEWFKDLDDRWQKLIIIGSALAAAIGPILIGIGTFITIAPAVGAAFTAMLGPIGLIIAAVAALAVGAFMLIKHWDEVSTFMLTIWNFLKDKAIAIFGAIKVIVLSPIIDMLETMINIREKFGGEAVKLRAALDKVNAAVETGTQQFNDNIGATWADAAAKAELTRIEKELTKAQKENNELVEAQNEQLPQTNDELQTLIDSIIAQNEEQKLLNKTNQEATEYVAGYVPALQSMSDMVTYYRGELARASEETQKITTMTDIWNQKLEETRFTTEGMANLVGTTTVEAFIGLADAISGAGDSMLDVVKGAFAAILRAIGEQLLALAAFYALTLRFGQSALAFAAGTAAIVASNFIAGMQLGGEVPKSRAFGDRQLVALEGGEQVIDKFTAERNRTEIDQMRMGGNGGGTPVVFSLDGKVLGKWILESSKNKQTKVYKGAIVS